jgi:hypothetical protein
MNMNSTSPSWAMTVRCGRTSAGEQHLRQVARQQPQHARAEHDPAQDLADDAGWRSRTNSLPMSRATTMTIAMSRKTNGSTSLATRPPHGFSRPGAG